jgi:EmrB/QacA subfamily drug resistance transporter
MSAVAMGIFLATIDGSIVNIALPTLTAEFGVPFAAVQWVVLAYLLTWATLSVTLGRLGDMIGKKPIYTSGFAVFTIGSALAGLAPGIYWLIGFRVLQAVGAAMVLSLGIALLTEAFPPSERGKALGIAGSMVSVGIVLGPSLGGLIIDALSWRWIFFVNMPIGIIGTVMAHRFIPQSSPPGGQRFDFLGAGLFFVTLITMLLGLSFGQEIGFTNWRVVALIATSIVGALGFLTYERRVDQPMLDLAMFTNSDFSIGLLNGYLVFVALAGMFITAPFFLSDTLGLSTRAVGLTLAASPVMIGITSPFSGRLSDRIGPRPVAAVGLTVVVIGYLLMQTLTESSSAWHVVLTMLPIGAGMGIFQSPNNSAIMGAVRPERLGVAGGMLGLNRLIGQITGIAGLSTFWVARLGARAAQSGGAAGAGAFRDVTLVGGALTAVAALLAWNAFRVRSQVPAQLA